MDNIQSNSQERLLKDRIRKLCTTDTYELIVAEIDKIVSANTLDYEKVASKLLEVLCSNVEVRNYYSYITSIVRKWSINEKENFQKDWKKPSFLALHLEMDRLGFTGEDWEKRLIDAVEEHALNEFPVDVNELIETNHAVINYCKERTYKEFLNYLLRSKLFKKINTPLEQLTKEAKEDTERWEKLLADLGTI